MEQAFLNQYVPYSQEAEEACIGAVIINPSMYYTVAAFLKAEDFFILRHQHIWTAIERLMERKDELDYISIQTELKHMDKLDEIGGPPYLTQLINNTPNSLHAEVYGRLVERAAVRRRLLSAADRMKMLALDERLTVDQVRASSEVELAGIQRAEGGDVTSLREALESQYDIIEQAVQDPKEMLGIPSVVNGLNAITKGYRKGKLYIMAGRPGMGKSSMMLTEAASFAAMGIPTAFFTLEMSIQEVTFNLMAAEIEIEADTLEGGGLTKLQLEKYVTANGRLSKHPLYIDDNSDLTPMKLLLKCRRLAHEGGLGAVFLDYAQLMNGGGEIHYNNRDQEIGYISRSLKSLAKELRIPVIAAAQLNRNVEDRKDKRPRLSDLRESGNFENDCDVAMFFYRHSYYFKPTEHEEVDEMEISIQKHRGGRMGMIPAGFWGRFKKVVNDDSAEVADVPVPQLELL